MINSTNWESIVVDERHIVDAKINRERKTVQYRMFSDKFGPVDFYSKKFLDGPKSNVWMKNMCVSAGNSMLFNQVRYEHPHQLYEWIL